MSNLASILSSITRGYLFTRLATFIHPELLTAIMYWGILAASPWLDYQFVDNFGNYVFVEFLMIHANVGMSVATFFAASERQKKIFLFLTGSFYMLFVMAMAIGFGAWWTAVIFLFLTYSRIAQPLHSIKKIDMAGEIFVTFIRFFIFMMSAVLAFGVAEGIFKSDDAFGLMTWGGCYYTTTYLLRYQLVRVKNTAIK